MSLSFDGRLLTSPANKKRMPNILASLQFKHCGADLQQHEKLVALLTPALTRTN